MTESTIKQEIEVANRNRPEIAVPTLLLLAGVYSGLAAFTFFALNGQLPMWLAALVNGLILYGIYTVVHEGVHNNIVSKKSKLKWINMTAAFLAAMPLWILIYPHRGSHIVHHTKCNTDADPDIYARGSFGVVTFWKIPQAILGQFNPLAQYQQCIKYGLTRSQRYFSMINFILYLAIVLTIISFGFGSLVSG